jgi:hypothetical protein
MAEKMVDDAMRPASPMGLAAGKARLGERYLVDHCPLDLVVTDAEGGKVLGRPWLVAEADAESSIVGCHFQYGPIDNWPALAPPIPFDSLAPLMLQCTWAARVS